MDIIDAQTEYSAEMRAEYKAGKGASEAITTVINRHKAIKAEKDAAEKTTTEENTAVPGTIESEPLAAPTTVTDKPTYAAAAVRYAVGTGLMKGKSETTVNPKDNASRAEIAAIMQRFIEANN